MTSSSGRQAAHLSLQGQQPHCTNCRQGTQGRHREGSDCCGVAYPSWPKVPRPQVNMAPEAETAAECQPLHETVSILSPSKCSLLITVGDDMYCLFPCPSWPKELSPHVNSLQEDEHASRARVSLRRRSFDYASMQTTATLSDSAARSAPVYSPAYVSLRASPYFCGDSKRAHSSWSAPGANFCHLPSSLTAQQWSNPHDAAVHDGVGDDADEEQEEQAEDAIDDIDEEDTSLYRYAGPSIGIEGHSNVAGSSMAIFPRLFLPHTSSCRPS
jgi:hypothetical protein